MQRFENIQVLLDSLILITPNILHVVMLLGLVMYVYALVGIYMFAKTLQRENSTLKITFLGWADLSLFLLGTLRERTFKSSCMSIPTLVRHAL